MDGCALCTYELIDSLIYLSSLDFIFEFGIRFNFDISFSFRQRDHPQKQPMIISDTNPKRQDGGLGWYVERDQGWGNGGMERAELN